MKPADPPGGLLPPAPPGRDLPRHDRHRRDLLAVIRAERTAERRWPGKAWLAPLGAAVAVLVIVAGVFVLPGVFEGPRPGGARLGGGTAPAAAGHTAGSGGQHGPLLRRTEGYLVSQAVTGIVVRGGVGALTVTGGNRSTVSITARLAYRGSAPVITRQVTGGVLALGYRCPSHRACQVSFDLAVPRGLGVTVRWAVGQIRLSGLAGPIAASTDVGRVQAGALSGPRIRLTTGTGQISAGFTVAPRQIVATSGVGSVTIRVPSDTAYQVAASTQVGSVRVAVPRAAGSGHVIQASTGAGAVTVAGS